MKSRTKNLIILVAVLAVIIVAIATVPGLLIKEEAAPEDTSISIALDADSISGLSWTYEGDSITLTRGGGQWIYEGDPAFPLDQSYPEAMLSELGGLKASSRLENPGGSSEYGLDSPALEITATAADGGKTVIGIGDQNSVNSEYYLTVSSDSSVYMVGGALVSAFSHNLLGLVKMEEMGPIDRVSGFTIEDGGRSMEVVYLEGEQPDYLWFLVGGGGEYLPLNSTKAATLKTVVSSVMWAGCADYSATADELAEYGLDDPAVVTVRYLTADDNYQEEKTVVYHIGSLGEEYGYVRLPDSDIVYNVDAEKLEKILVADYASVKADD